LAGSLAVDPSRHSDQNACVVDRRAVPFMAEGMNTAPTTKVAIPLSKGKVLLFLAGAVAFVAVGIFLWSIAETQDRYNALYVKVVALVSMAGFGLSGVYFCIKLFDGRPGLIIDAEGIVDNSSGVAAGRIPWSEIVGLSITTIRRASFVTVHVTDPYKYVERAGALKRMIHSVNIKMVGSPINISSVELRIPFDELVRLLSEAHERHTRKVEE